jgi:MoaA/NifB/PqqE/SkfB family radical SAM enzyme
LKTTTRGLVKKIHWSAHQDCNMQCRFCYLWRRSKGSLSTQDLKELLRQAADSRIEWFVFGGGDPLMRKDLPELLKYAKHLGLKTDLQTNGLLLDETMFASIYKYLDKIGMSLDGQDVVIHDEIRQYPGHFGTVLNALEMCQRESIPVTIRTIVCRGNVGKISGLGKILKKYKTVKKWSIREFVPLERGKINNDAFLIKREDFLREFEEIRLNNNPTTMGFPIISITADEMNNCYCMITPDGHFYNHPSDGIYRSFGRFPQDTVEDILARLDYNAPLRKLRYTKEEQFLLTYA